VPLLSQTIKKKYLNRNIWYSTTSSASENKIKPVVEYPNADTQKLEILRDNKRKPGIYR